MEGAVTFEVASELVLAALCGFGFIAWIACDATASILDPRGAGRTMVAREER
jgi:hypothetical protein